MKPSPLHLEWLAFPRASYEAVEPPDGMEEAQARHFFKAPIKTTVNAEVQYFLEDGHYAAIQVENSEPDARFKFSLEVVAKFSFEVEAAKKAYGDTPNLPHVIAANISRILYSSARENLATMTSRSPLEAALIESIIIEPSDVKIGSDVSPQEIMRDLFKFDDHPVFHLTNEEASEGPETPTPKSDAKKPKA